MTRDVRFGVLLVGLSAAALAAWLFVRHRRVDELRAAADRSVPIGQDVATSVSARVRQARGDIAEQASDHGSEVDLERAGRALLAASRAAYQACDTYEDDGTLDVVFRGDAGDHVVKEFRTAYAGPHAVRFAYRDVPHRFHQEEVRQVVATDGGVRILSSWGAPGESESLEDGLQELAGVSSGLSRYILPLLASGVALQSALDVVEPRLAGADEIDGVVCDRVEALKLDGEGKVRERVLLWISHDDHLLRRLAFDNVESDEHARQRATAMRRMMPSAEARLREAGIPDEVPRRLADGVAQPLNTFETVNYHPRCNQPVSPNALKATDSAL